MYQQLLQIIDRFTKKRAVGGRKHIEGLEADAWQHKDDVHSFVLLLLLHTSNKGTRANSTKIPPLLKNKPYREHFQILNLPTLKFRRLRGNMIETYKYYMHHMIELLHLIFLFQHRLSLEVIH